MEIIAGVFFTILFVLSVNYIQFWREKGKGYWIDIRSVECFDDFWFKFRNTYLSDFYPEVIYDNEFKNYFKSQIPEIATCLLLNEWEDKNRREQISKEIMRGLQGIIREYQERGIIKKKD